MTALTAFFDANVADVHEEWISSLLRKRLDLSRAQLERTRTLMDKHAENALVVGYEDLIPSLSLPDPDDRHVLAAAIRGRADIIVTMNLRNFPAELVVPFGIEAQHPDDFILHLLHLAPDAVAAAAETHRPSCKNPAKTAAEYLKTLERQGLTQTVCLLRNVIAWRT